MKVDELVANSIKILDDSGRVKIHLKGGGGIHGAAILMYSDGHPAMQILENPHEDRIFLSFYEKSGRSTSISENGICIEDFAGRPAVVIGCGIFGDIHQLTILKDGVPIFQMPLETDQEDDDQER